MTTIQTLNIAEANAVETAFQVAPKTAFLATTLPTDNEDKVEAIYRKTSGDDEFPMTARFGRYINRKANDGIGKTNCSFKLSTFAQKTDVDDVIWTLPEDVIISWNAPGVSGAPDPAGLVKMLQWAMSFVVPVIEAAASSVAIDEIKFGVVDNLHKHADSGSL